MFNRWLSCNIPPKDFSLIELNSERRISALITIFWKTLRLSDLDIQVCVDLPVDSRRRVEVTVFQHSRTVEVLQDAQQASSVPVICHSAAVIDLPSGIF